MAAIGTVLNAGKAILDAAKTSNESSAESSATVDVNPFEETPMEIKRTEGDLGYDEEPVKEETPQEHIDEDPTANPMDVKEVADVEETERPELPKNEPLKPLGGGFSEIFSKEPGEASESSSDFFSDYLNEVENGVPVNYSSTKDTGSFSGSLNGAPAIGSEKQSNPAQPLKVPQDVDPFENFFGDALEEGGLLKQAEKAYDDDKDIDDKELPFVKNEQAAEDVEDVVQAVEEGSLDEKKAEEVLQKAVDGGKIDGDEIDFNSFLESVAEKDPKNKFSNELDKRFGNNSDAKKLAIESLRRKFADPNGVTDRKRLQEMIDQIDAMDSTDKFSYDTMNDLSQRALNFVEDRLPGSIGDKRDDLYREDPEHIRNFLGSKLRWLSDKVYPVPEDVAIEKLDKLPEEEREKLLQEVEDETLDTLYKDQFKQLDKADLGDEDISDAKKAKNRQELEQQNFDDESTLNSYKDLLNELKEEPAKEEELVSAGETNEAPKEEIPEETKKEPEKKGVLDTINDKLDETKDKWEKSPAKKLLDKGKDLAGKGVKLGSILYALFNPKSVSASSGETVAVNKYEDGKASTTSGGMGYGEGGPVEGTSSSGSAPSAGGSIASVGGNGYGTHKEQPVNTRVASRAGLGSIESKSQKGATSSGSSAPGSVRDTFNKILAQGAAYSPSKEGSHFESALGGGRIGSVSGSSGASLGQLPKEVQAKMQSEYEKIKQQVQADYKNWPKRGDLHVKEKGSISVRTENGKEIGVKLGTRRQTSLESIAQNAPEKLRIVEEVI